MKFQPWLSTCSSIFATATDDGPSPPPEARTPSPKHPLSDTSTSTTSSQEASSTISSSLQSNLSLLTLPSVPSLQKLSPENLNLSITTLCLTSLKPHHALVNFLAINRNLLYAASGNAIDVFDINSFTLVDKFNAENYPLSGSVKSISFCKGKIFTAHQDCKIRVWKLASNKQHKLIATLPTLDDRLRHVLLPKNYVRVRRHKKKLWVEHHDAVSGLAMAADESLMYSISWDRYIKVWRVNNMRCMESIKAHDDAINAVVVSSVDGTVFTGSADRRIKVWGRPYGEIKKKYVLIATLEKHKSAVNALALSDDGLVLFSGSNDRSILVWEREDSANHMVVTGALRGHSRAILCLVNASDLLFSGSADRTVRIWQRGIDGRYCCLTVLDGHQKPVRSMAVVADSGESSGAVKVVSGSFDGEIKVWQVVVSSFRSPSPYYNNL